LMPKALLRLGLARSASQKGYRLTLQGWAAEELPGTDICHRNRLYDEMDG
jgi:hypothetical protein